MYLFWSVDDSEHFQGYARMASAVRREPTPWLDAKSRAVDFDNVFDVQWLNQYAFVWVFVVKVHLLVSRRHPVDWGFSLRESMVVK